MHVPVAYNITYVHNTMLYYICQDTYQVPGVVMGYNGFDSAYDDPNSPRERAETGPSIRTQEKVKTKGRAPRTVYKSERVEPCGPPLPPLPPRLNHGRTNPQPKTDEPFVYDSIEEMETVLKVTEQLKKVCNITYKNCVRLYDYTT